MARNPIHAVLFLIIAFLTVIFTLIILRAEFIALVIGVVYIGAVSILFLFVVMMLNIKFREVRKEFTETFPVGGIIGVIFFIHVFLIALVKDSVLKARHTLADPEKFEDWLSKVHTDDSMLCYSVIYTYCWYLLILIGFVLLIAILGAIILTLEKPNDSDKKQQGDQQVTRKSANSVFLVKEKKTKEVDSQESGGDKVKNDKGGEEEESKKK